MALAHATTAGLPISQTAVAYLGVAVVVLTTLALRASWVRPRLERTVPRPLPLADGPIARIAATVSGSVGAVVVITLLVVALTGDPASGANLAPLAIFYVLWLCTAMAGVLLGEAASLWNPWLGLGRVADRLRQRQAGGDHRGAGPDLWWLGPFGLWTLLALQLAWDGGNGPRAMGRWLLIYSLIFGVGAVAWGSDWVRRHDPFVVASRVVGTLSPVVRTTDGVFGWRRPLTGLSPDDGEPTTDGRRTIDGLDPATVLGVCAVMIGGAVFQRVRASRWWTLHAINRSLAITDLAHLAGLTWFVGMAAAVWLAATRAAERQAAGDAGAGASTTLAAVTVPLAVGLTVARFVELFALQIQNVVLMASDPFDKGWDLFGTINWTFHPRPFTPTGRGWLQLALVVAGLIGALVVAHDRLVAAHGAAGARRAQPVVVLTVGGVGIASLLTLLGA
jgi:hypothetical protein